MTNRTELPIPNLITWDEEKPHGMSRGTDGLSVVVHLIPDWTFELQWLGEPQLDESQSREVAELLAKTLREYCKELRKSPT